MVRRGLGIAICKEDHLVTRDYTKDKPLHNAEDAIDDLETLCVTAWGSFTEHWNHRRVEDFDANENGIFVGTTTINVHIPLFSGTDAAKSLAGLLRLAAGLLENEIQRQAGFAEMRAKGRK